MLNKQGFDAHIARICHLVDERNCHFIPAKWVEANKTLDNAVDDLWVAVNE